MSKSAKKVGRVSPCAPRAVASSGVGGWIDCRVEMPDSDLTVLIYYPDEDEPVWVGYHDGTDWRAVCGAIFKVSHWMNFPAPPN